MARQTPVSAFHAVDAVLVAEFDIDRGSTLTHEFPRATGCSPSHLAELMLPDGAHLHPHSWSVFVLNRVRPDRRQPDLRPLARPFVDVALWQLDHNTPLPYFSATGTTSEAIAPIYAPVGGVDAPLCTLEVAHGGLVIAAADGVTPLFDLVADQFECRFWDASTMLLLASTATATCAFAIRFLRLDDSTFLLHQMERCLPSVIIYHGSVPLPPPSSETIVQSDTRPHDITTTTTATTTTTTTTQGTSNANDKPPILEQSNSGSSLGKLKPPTPIREPLLYALTLVQTRQIPGVRRGARVKSIALVSQYSWLHVYKNIMSYALDKYFMTPTVDVVAELYHAVNSIDLMPIPRLSQAERIILRKSDYEDTYEPKFIEQALKAEAATNVINSGKNAASAFTLRGTQVGIRENKPQKQSQKELPADWVSDRHFYDTILSAFGRNFVLRLPLCTLPAELFDFSIMPLLNLFTGPQVMVPNPAVSAGGVQWINGSPYHWHPHLDWGPNTSPIVILCHAVLLEKRVLFVGDKRSSTILCEMVLGIANIASCGGTLVSNILDRCFPYACLANVDELLDTPGYIAGVANPVFEEQPAWWDVLCNVNTGKITISPKFMENAHKDCSVVEHNSFNNAPRDKDRDIKKIMLPIVNELDSRISTIIRTIKASYSAQSVYGEYRVRDALYQISMMLVRFTIAHENGIGEGTRIGLRSEHVKFKELVAGRVDKTLVRREYLEISKHRIDKFRRTTGYSQYRVDFTRWLRIRSIKDVDVKFVVERLRESASLPQRLLMSIVKALQDVICGPKSNEGTISELLSEFPLCNNGVTPLAVLLCNPRWEVKHAVCRVLRRLSLTYIGSFYLSKLNEYLKLAYDTNLREFDLDLWPLTIEEVNMPNELLNYLAPLSEGIPPTKGGKHDGQSTNGGGGGEDNGGKSLQMYSKVSTAANSNMGYSSADTSNAFADTIGLYNSEHSVFDEHRVSRLFDTVGPVRNDVHGSIIHRIKERTFKKFQSPATGSTPTSSAAADVHSATSKPATSTSHSKEQSSKENPVGIEDREQTLRNMHRLAERAGAAAGQESISPPTQKKDDRGLLSAAVSLDTLALNSVSESFLRPNMGSVSTLDDKEHFSIQTAEKGSDEQGKSANEHQREQNQQRQQQQSQQYVPWFVTERYDPTAEQIVDSRHESWKGGTLFLQSVHGVSSESLAAPVMDSILATNRDTLVSSKQYSVLAKSFRNSADRATLAGSVNVGRDSEVFQDSAAIRMVSDESLDSIDMSKFDVRVPTNTGSVTPSILAKMARGPSMYQGQYYMQLYQRLLGTYSYKQGQSANTSDADLRYVKDSAADSGEGESQGTVPDPSGSAGGNDEEHGTPDTLDNRATLYMDETNTPKLLEEFRKLQETNGNVVTTKGDSGYAAKLLLRNNLKRVSDIPTLYSRPSSMVITPTQRSHVVSTAGLPSSNSLPKRDNQSPRVSNLSTLMNEMRVDQTTGAQGKNHHVPSALLQSIPGYEDDGDEDNSKLEAYIRLQILRPGGSNRNSSQFVNSYRDSADSSLLMERVGLSSTYSLEGQGGPSTMTGGGSNSQRSSILSANYAPQLFSDDSNPSSRYTSGVSDALKDRFQRVSHTVNPTSVIASGGKMMDHIFTKGKKNKGTETHDAGLNSADIIGSPQGIPSKRKLSKKTARKLSARQTKNDVKDSL